MMVYGKFVIDDDAKALQKEALAPGNFEIAVASMEEECVWTCEKKFVPDDPFDNKVTTVEEFYRYLAKHSIIDPNFECHTVSIVKQDGEDESSVQHTIKSSSPMIFQTLPRPRNIKADFVNIGSSVAKTDLWTDLLHKLGYVKIMFTWKYVDTPQFAGIVPEKPTIVLSTAIKVQKDTLRRLA